MNSSTKEDSVISTTELLTLNFAFCRTICLHAVILHCLVINSAVMAATSGTNRKCLATMIILDTNSITNDLTDTCKHAPGHATITGTTACASTTINPTECAGIVIFQGPRRRPSRIFRSTNKLNGRLHGQAWAASRIQASDKAFAATISTFVRHGK